MIDGSSCDAQVGEQHTQASRWLGLVSSFGSTTRRSSQNASEDQTTCYLLTGTHDKAIPRIAGETPVAKHGTIQRTRHVLLGMDPCDKVVHKPWNRTLELELGTGGLRQSTTHPVRSVRKKLYTVVSYATYSSKH